MNKKLSYSVTLLLCIMLTGRLRAQNTPDSALTNQERAAIDLYKKTMGDRLGIYRGPAILAYTLRSTTNPYFRDTLDYYDNGTVNYDHRLYYHVPLRYNIERDMLETRSFNAEPYTLLTDRIIDFNLLGRHIVRFVPDANNKIMAPGFYELLYNGKIQVLTRHVKTVQAEVGQRGVSNVFYPKTTYFLKKGSVYYNVGSRGKFLDALTDKKKELQQYLKDNKIDFNDNPDRAMISLATYYDHLTN